MLHLVFSSNFYSPALKNCLSIANKNDAILLLESGVESILDTNWEAPCEVYLLEADILARGLKNKIPPSFLLINDQGFVGLSINHEKSKSWF